MRAIIRRLMAVIVALALGIPALTAHAAGPTDPKTGRELIFRNHVDAAHIAWENGGLAMKIVKGSTVVDPDHYAVRLGPDADPSTGKEVSRIKARGGKFSFLGAPGTIWWDAPSQYYDGWPPVWAGVGAGQFPQDVLDNVIYKETTTLVLEKLEGPGKVEIYTDLGDRLFSSTDPRFQTTRVLPGDHSHIHWSFSKPGRYTFTWKARAQLRKGGYIESKPKEVPWLVGTDEQVGLPAGTTPANPIKIPVEKQPDPTPAPDPGPGDGGPDPVYDPNGYNPTKEMKKCTIIDHGHQDIRASWKEGYDEGGFPNPPEVVLKDDSTSPSRMVHSGEAVLLVPDSAKNRMPASPEANKLIPQGHSVWSIPQVQQKGVPWLGYSTEDIQYGPLKEVHYEVGLDDAATKTAQAILGTVNFGTFTMTGDLREPIFYPQRVNQPTHEHKALLFSHPGFYSVVVTYKIRAKKNSHDGDLGRNYQDFTFVVAVGDDAIKDVKCKQANTPKPTPTPTPKPTPTPTPKPTPKPAPKPTPAPAPKPTPAAKVEIRATKNGPAINKVPQAGTFWVAGSGFTPGQTVSVVLHSKPITLPAVTADKSGAFLVKVNAARLSAGRHHVVASQHGLSVSTELVVTTPQPHHGVKPVWATPKAPRPGLPKTGI